MSSTRRTGPIVTGASSRASDAFTLSLRERVVPRHPRLDSGESPAALPHSGASAFPIALEHHPGPEGGILYKDVPAPGDGAEGVACGLGRCDTAAGQPERPQGRLIVAAAVALGPAVHEFNCVLKIRDLANDEFPVTHIDRLGKVICIHRQLSPVGTAISQQFLLG